MPGAAQQPQQEGLGLIVARVPDGDRRRRSARRRRARKRRSAPRGRRLRSSACLPAPAPRRRRAPRRTGRQRARPQRRAERLVVVGRAAQLVIQVRGAGDRQLAVAARARGAEAAAPPNPRRRRAPRAHGPAAAAGRADGSCRRTRARATSQWSMANGNGQCGNRHCEPVSPHWHFSEKKWCRCRDLNPGQRGYEPRALTN